MYSDIDCVFSGIGKIGSIYIANFHTANNIKLLQSNFSTDKYFINRATNKIRTYSCQKQKIYYPQSLINQYLYIQADDTINFPIQKYFTQTYDFIQKSLQKTNLLIHCNLGISRSATIVLAYLIKKYSYTFSEVCSIVKKEIKQSIFYNDKYVDQTKSRIYKKLQQFSYKVHKCDNNRHKQNLNSLNKSKQFVTTKVKDHILRCISTIKSKQINKKLD